MNKQGKMGKKLQHAVEYANEVDSKGKSTAKPNTSKSERGKKS
ncbi:hypothetical protein [Bacillus aquiflavi]|nr:hypothetical protein [Bacillus aquiflavi]